MFLVKNYFPIKYTDNIMGFIMHVNEFLGKIYSKLRNLSIARWTMQFCIQAKHKNPHSIGKNGTLAKSLHSLHFVCKENANKMQTRFLGCNWWNA